MNTLLALLGVFLAIVAANFLTLFFVRRWINEQKAVITDGFKEYFESPGDDKPSQFALAADLLFQMMASKIVVTLKSTFMGMQSGASRQMKAAEGEMAVDAMPLAGAIPGVDKFIKKYPLVAMLAQNFIGSKLNGMTGGGGVAVAPPANGHGGDVFKL